MNLSKKLLFALTPLVMLFAALEGGLWLAGLPARSQIDDPYVGFAAEIPLFVPVQGEDGKTWMRTAANKLDFFNDQEFVVEKPPGARRVFCLGGSTTYGRPYRNSTSFCGWLERYLRLASPETTWEVVNAGGISYASYRAAALMEELTRFQPDLFVVYSGHNEFLEERTYRSLRDRPAALRWLDIRLRKLRSYAALERLLASTGLAAVESGDREELSAEVETLLESSVGPAAYHRDDALSEAIVEHYRLNVDRMIALARRSGAELVLVVPADNLSASSPFKSEPSSTLIAEQHRLFAVHIERAEAHMKLGQWAEARLDFESAVEIDPRHSQALYGLGRSLLAIGEFGAARKQLTRARDEDVCPLRAISPIVEATRSIASDSGVRVIDFPRLLAAASADPERPRGEDWFLDHVHPTIEGHQVLARALLRAVGELGWLPVEPDSLADQLRAMEERALENLASSEHGVALRNLAKVTSWAGKYEDAARMATRALAILGEDSESYFLLAINASALADHDQAVAFLREALRIEPSWTRARHNLAVELSRAGHHEEALEHYDTLMAQDSDHPSLGYNRANALLKLGRLEEAIAGYRLAIEQDSMDTDARFNLARAYKKAGKLDRAKAELESLLEADGAAQDVRGELEALADLPTTARSSGDETGRLVGASERGAASASKPALRLAGASQP
jgi:tetratricopeptide (TPR) repeat protein